MLQCFCETKLIKTIRTPKKPPYSE